MGKAASTTPTKRRWARAKVIVPVTAVLLLVIAHQTGLLGVGWARLMSSIFPGDESLLAYLPNDISGFAVVDPHRVELKALGPEQGPVRAALEARIRDVKKVADIDLTSDVDKLVLSPTLVVGRGRFKGEPLAQRLVEFRYARAKHRSVDYLVRKDADAIAIIEDSVLLYGDEEAIKRAIDAKEDGASMKNDAKVMARLDLVGWDHAMVVTVRLVDDKPSLRDMLAGSNGPRAVTFAVDVQDGVNVRAAIEAATPSAAEDLKKLLEERLRKPEVLAGIIGPSAGQHLTEITKGATPTIEPGTSTVSIRAHVPLTALDAAVQALGAQESSLSDTLKKFKLGELLGPVPKASETASASASASASAPVPAASSAIPQAPASATAPEPAPSAAPVAPPSSVTP